ncbi:transcription elongation factor GreA [bacterium]|nr:transcription elongation factor GreA [bacterium]MBU1615674.1 transcription elongation factor GreA [bacterium]
MANLLTKEGYKKLIEELEHLKKVKRRELSKAIGVARELGDLKENAEYHSAKEEQGRVEAKIRQLETTLAGSTILEHERLPDDQVCIGIKVKLKDLNNNSELTYTVVSPPEADYAAGKISIISPVAKGLLGKKVGDKAEIRVPAGMLRYEILDMER